MSSLRVLSVCPPLLVLSTDTRRYLFGVPEGTQRLAIEHRVRLLRLGAICELVHSLRLPSPAQVC